MHSRTPRLRLVRLTSVLAAGALSLLGFATFAPAASADSTESAVPIEAAAQPVPDQYIVTLRGAAADSPAVAAGDLTDAHGGTVLQVYDHALDGFAVTMTEDEVHALASDPAVASIQQDSIVEVTSTQSPTPSWGLDRIDQQNLPLNNSSTFASTGLGVHAYVIDTGIRVSHTDFGGRASVGVDFVGDGQNGNDCNGHGTHVAGTIGGTTYGVAKQASLVAVRVLSCSGTGFSSNVIKGIDWVTANAVLPAVANLSLSTSTNPLLDTAVKNSIAKGITYSIAAGNGVNGAGINACQSSPASVTEALVVGASNSTDTRAAWSNTGPCLDLFAPGVGISSDWIGSDSDTRVLDGTSMAAPHVAGVAAQYISRCPAATPAQVASMITAGATANHVQDAGSGSPNRLLFSGLVGLVADAPFSSMAAPQGAPCAAPLTATAARSTVHLSWSTPAGGGSPITSYRVYRGTSADGTDLSPIATTAADATRYDDTNVVNGTAYYYQLAAVNTVGETRSMVQTATPALLPQIVNGAGPITAAGVLGTPITAVSTAGARVVLARGADNAVYRYQSIGSAPAVWESLGGAINANPVAVADAAGIAVFVRGLDNAVYYGRIDNAGAWSGFTYLGGWINANIAATADSSGIVLFVRGGGDAIWYGRLNTAGSWSGWNYVGGQITSDPVAVTNGANVSVIARGLGGAVWYGRLTNGTTWTGWRYLGGQITSNIAAAVDGSGIEIFVRGLGDTVWQGRLATGDSFSGWRYLGGQIISDPVAVTDGTGVEVLVNGLGGGLWHGRLTNGSAWSGWNYLGGVLASNAAATVDSAGVEVLGNGGGAVWQGRLTNGTTWSGWSLPVG